MSHGTPYWTINLNNMCRTKSDLWVVTCSFPLLSAKRCRRNAAAQQRVRSDAPAAGVKKGTNRCINLISAIAGRGGGRTVEGEGQIKHLSFYCDDRVLIGDIMSFARTLIHLLPSKHTRQLVEKTDFVRCHLINVLLCAITTLTLALNQMWLWVGNASRSPSSLINKWRAAMTPHVSTATILNINEALPEYYITKCPVNLTMNA